MNRLMLGPCTAFSRCSRSACVTCCNVQVVYKQTCVDFQENTIIILGETPHLSQPKWCAKWHIAACQPDPRKCRHSHIFRGGLVYCNRHCQGFAVSLCPYHFRAFQPDFHLPEPAFLCLFWPPKSAQPCHAAGQKCWGMNTSCPQW